MAVEPIEIRRMLAQDILGGTNGILHGVIMEPTAQLPSEEHDEYFLRLEQEHNVEAYFLVLPLGCNLAGLLMESGMLLRDFHHGVTPGYVLFLEQGLATGDPARGFLFQERGRRTRYLESLAKRAASVWFWKRLEELRRLVVQGARARL